MKTLALVLALTALLFGQLTAVSAHDAVKLGTVHFPVSCAPAVFCA